MGSAWSKVMTSEKNDTGMLRTLPPDPDAVKETRPWQHGHRSEYFRDHSRMLPIVLSICVSALLLLSLFAYDNEMWAMIASPMLIVLLGVVVCMCWHKLHEWLAGDCPRCGSNLAELGMLSLGSPVWCPNCDFLLKSFEIESVSCKWDTDIDYSLESSDPATRVLGMLITLGMADQVDVLGFVPGEDDYRCYVQLNGATHELDPPPAHLHRRIAAAARAIWGCDPHGNVFCRGMRLIGVANTQVNIEAEFTPSPAGEKVVLRFESKGINNSMPAPR